MSTIKVLLVGSGAMATEHFKAFSSISNFRFMGVVARNKNKLKNFSKKFNIPNYFIDLDKAYLSLNPDLVIIAVSELSTYKICQKVSKYNSVLFIEKPLGYNYSETKKIVNLFNKRKSLAFIALNRRHFNSTRNLKTILEKQKTKRLVTVNDQEDLIQQHKNKVPKKIIKNFMYANSVHLIDYFNFLCRGKLIKVHTYNNFNKPPFFVHAVLYFSSGDKGIYNAIYNKDSPWYVSVKSDNKIYVLKPLEILNSNQKIKKKRIKFSNDKKFKPGFRLQAKEILNFFEGKKYNLPSYKDVFNTVKIIKKIYQ